MRDVQERLCRVERTLCAAARDILRAESWGQPPQCPIPTTNAVNRVLVRVCAAAVALRTFRAAVDSDGAPVDVSRAPYMLPWS